MKWTLFYNYNFVERDKKEPTYIEDKFVNFSNNLKSSIHQNSEKSLFPPFRLNKKKIYHGNFNFFEKK